jgi:hypothetical protein
MPVIHSLDHAIQYSEASSDDVGIHSLSCLGGQPVKEASQNKGDEMFKSSYHPRSKKECCG